MDADAFSVTQQTAGGNETKETKGETRGRAAYISYSGLSQVSLATQTISEDKLETVLSIKSDYEY